MNLHIFNKDCYKYNNKWTTKEITRKRRLIQINNKHRT